MGSALTLFTKSCAQALAAAAAGNPACAACLVVLSGVLESEPAKKLAEKLGDKLAESLAEYLHDSLLAVTPGSLPEAYIAALAAALRDIRKENKPLLDQHGLAPWFDNWDRACANVRHHRWKNRTALTSSIGELNRDHHNWEPLRETLTLLNWSARLSGDANANRDEMPPPLEALLKDNLAPRFIQNLIALLSQDKYKPAIAEGLVEAITLTGPAPPPRINRLLDGPNDPRLLPMRGYFIGRTEKLNEVAAFLTSDARLAVVTGRLFSLRGAPGIGKTELCKAALRAHLQANPACRAYYADATGNRSLDGLLAAVATALGDEKLAENQALLLHELGRHADLLYIDNLEDALATDRAADAPLFAWLEQLATQPTKILVSSRERLGHIAREISVDRFDAAEALQVFEHFWNNAGGQPLDDQPTLARFLDEDLGHHALTLRLLAAQAEDFATWQNLRDLWRRRRTRLAQDEDRRERLTSLDVSISLSYERACTLDTAKELWIALACFPEGMSSPAQSVILPDEESRLQAFKLLRRLSVIEQRDDRLHMLAPLRQYAAGLAVQAVEPVWARCLRYFFAVAMQAKSTELGSGEGRAESLRVLAAEFPNLKTGLLLAMHCPSLVDPIAATRSALLNSFQFHAVAARDLLAELSHFFERTQRPRDRANTLKSLGDLESRLGDVNGARLRYQEALRLFESEQDNLGLANTLQSLGDLESRLGDVNGARLRYQEALRLFESEQANLGRANTLKSLGDLERRLGDVNGARLRYQEALRLFESEQANLGRANTLKSLGDLESRLGDVNGARLRYQEALRLFESEQANLGRANTLKSLGDLESRLGDVNGARLRYQEALRLYESEQDNLGRANTLKSLGDLESRLGDVNGARLRYQEALRLYESEQDNLGRANTLQSLGDLESHLGDVNGARLRYQEALRLYESEQDNLGLANTLQSLGLLALAGNDIEQALAGFQDAAELYEREQEPAGLAQSKALIAILSAATGDHHTAAQAAAEARAAAQASNEPPVIEYVESLLRESNL